MRILSRFVAVFTAFIFVGGVASAQPKITAFIGAKTPTSKVGYFVLDFDDAEPNPETYAFGWNYEGTPSGADFLTALETDLTGPNGFTQEGAADNFVTRLGYNGRSISATNVGYWNFWIGQDGANWTSSNFGVRDITISPSAVYSVNPFDGKEYLSGGPWFGVRWVNDFNTDTPAAPRTPGLAAAAPEPATVGYWALGFGCWAAVSVARRRRA